jgi:hypothetical protein
LRSLRSSRSSPPRPAPPPPCADATRHPALAPLARALERPETWRDALDGIAAGEGPARGEDPDVAACRHYLVGAAAFFLSERSAELAPRAVEHLLAAHLLAPRAMGHVQARSRLRTAWARQNALPGTRPSAGPAPAPVEFVTTGAAHPFTLRPAEADGPTWHLPAPPPGATPASAFVAHLPLPPGRYRATVNGRCGGSDIDFMVASGASRVTLPAPPLCFVHLAAVDAEGRALADARVVGPDGAAVDATRVPSDDGEALVSAPGHQTRRVPLASSTGRQVVPLERCPVAIVVDPVPADAQVDGAGEGPWGTRRVAVRRAGYADREFVTEIPAPATCETATAMKLVVRLARPVRFSARMDDGLAATPGLTINGLDTPTTGLELEPGTYRYEARLPESPPVNGRLVVPACTDLRCPPRLPRRHVSRASAGPHAPRPVSRHGGGRARVRRRARRRRQRPRGSE